MTAAIAVGRAFSRTKPMPTSDVRVGEPVIMDEPGVVIRYNDSPVGYFDHGLVPDRPGRYDYMPFRNAAHLEFAQAATNGARPRCSISHDAEQVSFEVIAIPEPHVMVLAKLETRPTRTLMR